MDVSHILDPLNEAQREAVTDEARHLLVLAGAGSGKTRVLTHRIAWVKQVKGVSPFSVLAVTFTNKAANEMRQRVGDLLGMPTNSMWVGTFHGLAHRLLRLHWAEAGLSQNFQILDADDQLRTVKRVIRAMSLDEAHWPPKQALWYINARKDEGVRAQHLDDKGNPTERQLIAIYLAYQNLCEQNGAIDFAELLLRSLELLRENPALLAHYQQRFTHILVDEFQDTNAIQYAWLKLLAGDTGSLFAVGDDDQSIYGWRGAQVENMLHFNRDYPGVKTVRLEQNYRSTGNILTAANALIAHNQDRLGKELWTDTSKGEPLTLFTAFNEIEEAQFVSERIHAWVQSGGRYTDCAILYRSNVLSRVLEAALLSAEIPYRVYGGMRFFERAEVKDALAYLRLTRNCHEDIAFERVVNQPARGIGERTVGALREMARQNQLSLWNASQQLIANGALKGRASKALSGFLEQIERLRDGNQGLQLDEYIEHVITHSGLSEFFARDRSEKGQSRLENLQELVGAARAFIPEDSDGFEGMVPLDQFLAQAALEAGEGQGNAWDDCVQMMTLHAAKGLEFPLVFMIGMEENLFPSERSLEETGRLDEERRLCYVGITRARQKLVLTHTEQRRLYGRSHYNLRSRFLSEIPVELLDEVRPRVTFGQVNLSSGPSAYAVDENSNNGFQIGQRVMHTKFGEGLIMSFEGQGRNARVQVNFERAGSKWLVLSYANLQLL